MKWYHFSIEYFEDLRNVNHCEFVVMKLNPGSGKYVLQNQLRTWSELKRERASSRASEPQSPIPMRKRWGGCSDGCSDGENGDDFARRQMARRQNTVELFGDDAPISQGSGDASGNGPVASPWDGEYPRGRDDVPNTQSDEATNAYDANVKMGTPGARKCILSPDRLEILTAGRDGGGSRSGAASPNRSGSEDSGAEFKEHVKSLPMRSSLAMALNGELDGDGQLQNRVRADALGDQSDAEDDEEEAKELKKAEARDRRFEGAVH